MKILFEVVVPAAVCVLILFALVLMGAEIARVLWGR